MKIENNLMEARKKAGLSQEEVAAKMSVSRQTISKWELNETTPDIYQAKKLATIYQMTLDDLLVYDEAMNNIEKVIKNTNHENQEKVNWTNVWGEKYPILVQYPDIVDVTKYQLEIRRLLNSLKEDYHMTELDSMLVLKDILAHEYKKRPLINSNGSN